MSLSHGKKLVKEGLTFFWDSANLKSTGLTGANSTNYNIYFDLVSGSSITSNNTNLYVDGKTYYTLYGITYPESSYAPANRDGITPGLNNTSAGKLYDCSRDMNYFVFDEDTNTWVSSSYFNGERIDGHCYDTYDGQPVQHATFQSDFDNISSIFPNATHIIIGSHAAENNDNDTATVSRLQSIGLPDSHIGIARPEYILVGKVNKPSTWNYIRENVSSAVVTMNLGLPLEPKVLNTGLTFNADTSRLVLPSTLGYSSEVSVFAWVKTKGSPRNGYHIVIGPSNLEISIPSAGSLRTGVETSSGRYVNNQGSGLTDGNWHYIGFTFAGTVKTAYIDGVAVGTQGTAGSLSSTTTYAAGTFGSSDTTYGLNGYLGALKVYDRAISAEEVKTNYDNSKRRYI